MGKKANSKKMIIFFFIVFAVVFVAVTGRFLYIQAKGEVNNVSLKEWAKDKREVSYPLKAERGKIYDDTGVMLAYDRPVFRIYAVIDPAHSKNKQDNLHVEDPESTAKELAKFIDIDQQEAEERLAKAIKENENLPEDERQFQIEYGNEGKNISQTTKNEIEEANIQGINFIEDATRYYPNGVFASHILGFARPDENSDEKEIQGIGGMEKVKNDFLKGENGHISFQRDKFNKKLLNSDEVVTEPEDGNDIYLTINQKSQTLLENVLSDVERSNNTERTHNTERITAHMMNPKTGEIVDMSHRPSNDPNQPEDVENWYNDIISTPVEPGSTVKMFTRAAAIDAGVYNGSDTYKSGKYQVNPRIQAIRDHNGGKGWGTISYDEGFRRSSNVAAAKIAWETLGTEKYHDYLKAFEFDKKTDIDLPSEVAGEILYNYPLEKITTSFGHGGTMTPIQQLKAATSIANKGKMMKPYVIKKIMNPKTNDILEEHEPKNVGEPISEEASSEVLDLLGDVVNKKDGTGKKFDIKDYTVGGKTGTAQMPDPDGKGYLTGKNNYVFSFLGMVPQDDPELIMYVSVTQPKLKDTEVGSDITSHIFTNVMGNSLKYLNIEPEKNDEDKTETIEMPKVIDKKTKEVEQELEKLNLKYHLIGDGDKVVASSVNESTNTLSNKPVILITNKLKMPDLAGWSKREILELENLLDIPIEINGDGFVTDQNIEVDEKINKKTKITVQLEKPF